MSFSTILYLKSTDELTKKQRIYIIAPSCLLPDFKNSKLNNNAFISLLTIAYCLLPTAYCLLPGFDRITYLRPAFRV